MSDAEIRPLEVSDRNWVADFLDKHWGSTKIVTRGKPYYAHLLPGFAATRDGDIVGMATYRIEGDSCELMTLDSLESGEGIGTALLEAVKSAAREAGCKRLWLITTNDNFNALRFYQKRGFALVAVYPNALEEARRLKPQIPLIGIDGVPLRDEIELAAAL